MGEQLSLKAAMPLAEILATCRKNVSNTGLWCYCAGVALWIDSLVEWLQSRLRIILSKSRVSWIHFQCTHGVTWAFFSSNSRFLSKYFQITHLLTNDSTKMELFLGLMSYDKSRIYAWIVGIYHSPYYCLLMKVSNFTTHDLTICIFASMR